MRINYDFVSFNKQNFVTYTEKLNVSVVNTFIEIGRLL